MSEDISKLEEIDNFIDSIKLDKEQNIFAKYVFRNLLQDYSLHQRDLETSQYKEVIQCFIKAANKKYELPWNYDYYIKTAIGAAAGGISGIIFSASIFLSSGKIVHPDSDFMIASTISFLGASMGVSLTHSIIEAGVFYDDSQHCLTSASKALGESGLENQYT